ncbi:MAG: hypothetical protein KGJ13_05270 [Patescibacteria group bacterium]|nr:hypothetical protein [Patescibacteria group bacterium]
MKPKPGRKTRKGATRIHLVIDTDLLERVRHWAQRDRQTVSAKVETLLEKACR